MAFTKIAAAGIGSTETVTLHSLEVLNNATVGGVLTYEDVTNVDSIGIVTARAGVLVGSGITLSKDGDVFFTGIATGNGSGLTALNASNISSGTVPTARLGSGTASSSTFLRGDSTFAEVTSTTINNNANDRLITGSGTANTLEGEANLTASAPSSGTGYVELKHGSSSGDYGFFQIRSGSTLRGRIGSNSQVDAITIDTAGGSSTAMLFNTGSSQTERLRITSDGKIGINQGTPRALLSLGPDIATQKLLLYDNDAAQYEKYGFGIQANELRQFAGGSAKLTFGHISSSDGSTFSERVRINSSGNVSIGGGDATPSNTAYNGSTLHLYQSGSSSVGSQIRWSTGASGHTTSDGAYMAFYTDNNMYCNIRESGDWVFYTSNTERFRIDSDGYVTKSNHPSFHANGVQTPSNSSGGLNDNISQYMTVMLTNIGSHYKTSGGDVGKFVVPVAGNYFFFGQALLRQIGNGIGSGELTFYKNNSNVSARAFGYTYVVDGAAGGQDHDNLHISAVIPCAVGDKIHLQTLTTDSTVDWYWGQGLGNFGGFLIG